MNERHTDSEATAGEMPQKASHDYTGHGRGDSAWGHAAEKTKKSVLGLAVGLTLTFSFVELLGGLWSNSLALIGDAGHMVTDSASLLFALIANLIAQRGADRDHSFGHGRVEVLAAFVNGIVMLGVVFWLFWEAFGRISNPEPVSGFSVMAIAAIGLVINLGVAWSLSRDKKNVNTRAALLHVMGDLLGSVAAIAAGAVIWMGGPAVIDPILSMLVGVMLLHATYEILRDASRVLLDGVPEGVELDDVGRFLKEIPSVRHVHDLHVWTMSPGHGAIQCHVQIESPACWPKILDAIRTGLHDRFGIDHVTVQPEWVLGEKGCDCACEEDDADCGCDRSMRSCTSCSSELVAALDERIERAERDLRRKEAAAEAVRRGD